MWISGYPIDLYPVCALLKKRAEKFLHESKIDREDINNLLFYVAMLVVGLHLRTPKAKAPSIANLTVDAIPQAIFFHATQMAKDSYAKFGATDIVAKGPDMAKDLRDQLLFRFSRKKRNIGDAETQ